VFRLDDGAQHEVMSAGNMAAAKQMAAAPAAKTSPRAAAPAPKTAAKPAAKPAVAAAATSKAPSGMNGRGPVGRMQTALAAAIKDGPEWEEF
jgi:hypothetical protein